jgi:hypothetical protein
MAECLFVGTQRRGLVLVAGAGANHPGGGGFKPLVGCLLKCGRGGGAQRSRAQRDLAFLGQARAAASVVKVLRIIFRSRPAHTWAW